MALVPFGRRRGLAPGNMFGSLGNWMDDFTFDAFAPFRSIIPDSFKLDVKENDKEYTVLAELPGIAKEDIALKLQDGRLTICVTRDENREEENEGYIHRERRCASMSRGLYLADAANDGVDAVLRDGILKITVPKRPDAASGTSIEIRS